MFWIWIGISIVLLTLLCADICIRVRAIPQIIGILEKTPPLQVTHHDPDSRGQDVKFPTADGITLAGSLFLPDEPRGVVVFCPELGANRWTALKYCEALLDSGFAIVSFDFRNHGDSDSTSDYEPFHWATDYELTDAQAALHFAREHPVLSDLPLGIVGVSRGGATALVAAAQNPDVQAILADSPFSLGPMIEMYVRQLGEIYMPRWLIRGSPMWYLRSLVKMAVWFSQRRRNCRYLKVRPWLPGLASRTVLLVSGRRDSYVKPQVVQALADRIGARCKLWLVDRAKHNRAREVDPEEYDKRLTELFTMSATRRKLEPAGSSD